VYFETLYMKNFVSTTARVSSHNEIRMGNLVSS